MTFAVSEFTAQYQCGAGGTGVGVEVGSGVEVAVFSTGMTSAGWDVDVALSCPTGAEVDSAGLAQADRNMVIANNRETIRFIDPLSYVLWSRNLDCTSIDVSGSFRANRFENSYNG